jgi:transcriptional regulator with XRE-family HTH domain
VYGAYIQRKREELNLSRDEAGALIGVSGDAVRKWEKDINSPSLENLDRIAVAFKCLIGDLLPNSGEGTFGSDFQPIEAALAGLDRATMRDMILMMASQVRLFRNAVVTRTGKSSVATTHPRNVEVTEGRHEEGYTSSTTYSEDTSGAVRGAVDVSSLGEDESADPQATANLTRSATRKGRTR